MGRLSLPAFPSWLPPLPSQLEAQAEQQARSIPPAPLAHSLRGSRIPVTLSDRWYILGAPGSGKTVFAKRLVSQLRQLYPQTNLYLLDSKGGGDFDGWPGLTYSETAPPPLRGWGQVQTWQPPEDNLNEYDAWLAGIRGAGGPAIVLIDELSSLGRSTGTSFVPSLGRLLKQGRGLRISPIVLTQESANIARSVTKMASQLIYFRVSRDDDHAIGQACRLLGFPVPKRADAAPEPRAKFGFFYRRLLPIPGVTTEYSGYHEFFGLAG